MQYKAFIQRHCSKQFHTQIRHNSINYKWYEFMQTLTLQVPDSEYPLVLAELKKFKDIKIKFIKQ